MRLVLVATLALAGCAWNQVLAWMPHSTQAHYAQSAKRAVMIGPGDTDDVLSAGGQPVGSLTMKGDSGLAKLHAAAAVEAARRGGTHYFVKSEGESVSTGPYGTVTDVEPRITYGVIRVSVESWPALPPALVPEKK